MNKKVKVKPNSFTCGFKDYTTLSKEILKQPKVYSMIGFFSLIITCMSASEVKCPEQNLLLKQITHFEQTSCFRKILHIKGTL